MKTEKYEKVNRWLNSIPVTDNPWHDDKRKHKSSDWNEWITQGKKINDIEKILLAMLHNENDDTIKTRILNAIGFVGSNLSYDALIEFSKHRDELIRMEAISAIGNLKLERAVPFLCECSNDADVNVRANVYAALGKLRSEKVLNCLQKGLSDTDAFVRTAAKAAIENFKTP